MATVAAIIPSLNEEKTIRTVIEAIPRDIVKHVMVVNDSSQDATSTVAKEAGAVVVSHGRNLGVGAAIKNGYDKGLNLSAEILVVVAGDGQHNPREIPLLIQPILDDDADYVVGDRLSGDSLQDGMPKHRYYANRFLSCLTSRITKLDIKDS